MSYDIYFVEPRADLSWDELSEEREAAAEASQDVPAALIEVWGRVTPQVEAILGEVELARSAGALELSHDGTGLDLAIFGDEISLSVPYWHDGERAAQVFQIVSAIVAIVERESGLIAFDPQAEGPFTASIDSAVSIMSGTAQNLRSRYGG
nr:hypothetical protein OH826_29675 [Streptomyces sp. NBC_00899]